MESFFSKLKQQFCVKDNKPVTKFNEPIQQNYIQDQQNEFPNEDDVLAGNVQAEYNEKENVKLIENVKIQQQNQIQNNFMENLTAYEENYEDLNLKLNNTAQNYFNQFEQILEQNQQSIENHEHKIFILKYFQCLEGLIINPQQQKCVIEKKTRQNEKLKLMINFCTEKKKEKEKNQSWAIQTKKIREDILSNNQLIIMDQQYEMCKQEMHKVMLEYEMRQKVKKFIADNDFQQKIIKNIPIYLGGDNKPQSLESVVLQILQEKFVLPFIFLKYNQPKNIVIKIHDIFKQEFDKENLLEQLEFYLNQTNEYINNFQKDQDIENNLGEQAELYMSIKKIEDQADEQLLEEYLTYQMTNLNNNQNNNKNQTINNKCDIIINKPQQKESIQTYIEVYGQYKENKIQMDYSIIWFKIIMSLFVQQQIEELVCLLSTFFNQNGQNQLIQSNFVFLINQIIYQLLQQDNFFCQEERQLQLINYCQIMQSQLDEAVEFSSHFKELLKLQYLKIVECLTKYNVNFTKDQDLKQFQNIVESLQFDDQRSRKIQQQQLQLQGKDDEKRKAKILYQQLLQNMNQQKYKLALEKAEACLAIRQNHYKDDFKNEDYRQIIWNLQKIYNELKNSNKALEYGEKLVQIFESVKDQFMDTQQNKQKYYSKLSAQYQVCYDYCKINDIKEKRILYMNKKLEIQNKLSEFQDTKKEQYNCLNILAENYDQKNETKKALKYQKKSLDILKQLDNSSDNKKIMAECYYQLSKYQANLKNFKQCYKNAQKSYNIRQEVLGHNNIQTLQSWRQYLYAKGESTFMFYGDVINEYEQLIKNSDNYFKDNVFTYETKIFYIQVLYKDNQFKKALSIINQISQGVSQKFGSQHKNTLYLQDVKAKINQRCK